MPFQHATVTCCEFILCHKKWSRQMIQKSTRCIIRHQFKTKTSNSQFSFPSGLHHESSYYRKTRPSAASNIFILLNVWKETASRLKMLSCRREALAYESSFFQMRGNMFVWFGPRLINTLCDSDGKPCTKKVITPLNLNHIATVNPNKSTPCSLHLTTELQLVFNTYGGRLSSVWM